MTCSNCSSAVERILHGLRGVRRANVALTLGEARVAYDAACVDEARLVPLLSFRPTMHITANDAWGQSHLRVQQEDFPLACSRNQCCSQHC